MNTVETRCDPYQAVTDLILEHLEKGTVPWRCPWNREVGRPCNFSTGKPYRGINVLLLGWRHCGSPWWLTYRQAQERGGHVRKGERGATVVKYGTFQAKGEGTTDAENMERDDARKSKHGYLRTFTVFNATQIEGVAFPATPAHQPLLTAERKEKAEAIIAAMPNPPAIHEKDITRAFYHVGSDEVNVPLFQRFETVEGFYETVFHEIVHASGHSSRLNRASLTKHDEFGGPVYSREELVAEMGAAFLGMEADIVRDRHEQSAAYLQGWLSVLKVKENKKWIVVAAAQAAKAADFILNRHEETVAA
jgi:antirestriction protein ArdC